MVVYFSFMKSFYGRQEFYPRIPSIVSARHRPLQAEVIQPPLISLHVAACSQSIPAKLCSTSVVCLTHQCSQALALFVYWIKRQQL